MKNLEICRKEIDEIDQQMIKLFEQRMNVAKDVVTFKLANNLEIFQADRETVVIEKNKKRISQDILKPYAELFMRDMMNISKSYQASFVPIHNKYELFESQRKDIVVGFPGVPGSFSEQAVKEYFGEITKRTSYHNFDDVFMALKNDEINYGVVPLENSSTGAINDNYDAIRDYGFFIVGQQSLSISQHLLGVKGSCIEELREVYSHPQGLLQSSEFLLKHAYMEQKEYMNTATAAKYISQQGNPQLAAIASMDAAKLYHLDILAANIQNIKNNSTRFIIFSKHLEKDEQASCVSVVFTVTHQVGALYQIMKIINDHQINMLRIESRPLKQTPWEYYFYVDFEGNLEKESIILALEDMKAHTSTLRVLGNYAKR